MCVASLFTECGFLITLFLANFATGDPVFTKTPENMTVEVGSNIVINWKYNTTNRNNFNPYSSPLWKYYDENDADYDLASEVKKGAVWKWEIKTASCPQRYLFPVQRIYKYKPEEQGSASLNITNVSLSDSGKYECQLKLMFDPTVESSMYLTVREALPVTTAAPTTPASTTTSSSTSSTTTTEAPTTVYPTEGLSTGAYIGIGFGVVAVCVLVGVGVWWWVKKKKDGRGKFQGIQMG